MPRPRSFTPSNRRHRPTNQAVCSVQLANAGRKDLCRVEGGTRRRGGTGRSQRRDFPVGGRRHVDDRGPGPLHPANQQLLRQSRPPAFPISEKHQDGTRLPHPSVWPDQPGRLRATAVDDDPHRHGGRGQGPTVDQQGRRHHPPVRSLVRLGAARPPLRPRIPEGGPAPGTGPVGGGRRQAPPSGRSRGGRGKGRCRSSSPINPSANRSPSSTAAELRGSGIAGTTGRRQATMNPASSPRWPRLPSAQACRVGLGKPAS
jgi:hypothetical protein